MRLIDLRLNWLWRLNGMGNILPGAKIIGVAAEVQDMKWIWEVFRLVISLGL
jgi:hypothetical protein